MKPQTKAKLVLARQTIRRLSAADLHHLQGGLRTADTHDGGCETQAACTVTVDCTRNATLCL